MPEQAEWHAIFDRGPRLQRIHMEEFAQVLGYAPKQKYGKGPHVDYASMLRLLEQLSAQPARDVPEFVRRLVAFILMGNTDAHLKNWAVRYPDGRTPELAPLYDPVCVTAFFMDADYAVNRAIDATVRAFTWDDLQALLKNAGLLRSNRLMQVAKATVKQAQADWPALLKDAPSNMRDAIVERLAGGVRLAGK